MKRAVEDVLKRAARTARETSKKKKKAYRTEVSIVGDAMADWDFLVLVEIDLKAGSEEFAQAKAMVLADATVQRLLSQGDKLEFEELVREFIAQ